MFVRVTETKPDSNKIVSRIKDVLEDKFPEAIGKDLFWGLKLSLSRSKY